MESFGKKINDLYYFNIKWIKNKKKHKRNNIEIKQNIEIYSVLILLN